MKQSTFSMHRKKNTFSISIFYAILKHTTEDYSERYQEIKWKNRTCGNSLL